MSELEESEKSPNSSEVEQKNWFNILSGYLADIESSDHPSGKKVVDPNKAMSNDVAVDQVVGNDAMSEEDYLNKTRAGDVTQQALNRAMQKVFFVFALILIGVPVIVSAVGFSWLFINDRMTDTIAAAFFASVVGQVIGLSAILGKHLFPENGMSQRGIKKSKKKL